MNVRCAISNNIPLDTSVRAPIRCIDSKTSRKLHHSRSLEVPSNGCTRVVLNLASRNSHGASRISALSVRGRRGLSASKGPRTLSVSRGYPSAPSVTKETQESRSLPDEVRRAQESTQESRTLHDEVRGAQETTQESRKLLDEDRGAFLQAGPTDRRSEIQPKYSRNRIHS